MTTGRPHHRTGSADTSVTGTTRAAATILIIGGVCHAMVGVVGLATNRFAGVDPPAILHLDGQTWSGVHLLIGIAAVIAGFGLFSHAAWATAVAVAVGAVTILVNLVSLPSYPAWAVLIFALDAFVIWTGTAHRRYITPARDG